jgi:hypothetical protein
MNAMPKDALTFTEVYEGFSKMLNRSHDHTPSKTMVNWVLEPPNPFDPNRRRKPKPELMILLTFLLLIGATFALLNHW